MYIDKATISKYTSYFHDGSLIAIEYGKNEGELILTMESAEVHSEDIKDPIPLSKEGRIKGKIYLKQIKGKLHLNGLKNIYIDNKKLATPLKMNYDDGDIFRFRIKDNEVLLHVIWINYPPKNRVDDCSTITIDVKDVWWENIPDLET